MTRCMLVALSLLIGAGCYDDHGRRDAGLDSAIPRDAAPLPDAWGDANIDAGPGPCFVDGRPIAGMPESQPDRVGCICPTGMTDAVGFRSPAPIVDREGPFALCVPQYNNGAVGITASLCDNANTIHRYLGPRAEAAGVDFGHDLNDGFGCLDAPSCLFAEAQLPETMRGGCLYGDYTSAITGTIAPTADCESLRREGLCAINCLCEDLSYPRCFGLSETHAVGVCTQPPACEGDFGCFLSFGPQSCVFAANVDSALRDDIYDTGFFGRCTRTPSCGALREATGETWSCGPEVPR